MSHSLDQRLARPIVLTSSPPRTLDTLLSAVEYLNSGAAPNTVEVDATIDLIMSAAASGDPALIEAVTKTLEAMLRQLEQA